MIINNGKLSLCKKLKNFLIKFKKKPQIFFSDLLNFLGVKKLSLASKFLTKKNFWKFESSGKI